MGKFRDGDLPVTPELVTLILESLDHIKGILYHLEQEGQEPAGDDSALIGKLELAAAGGVLEDTDSLTPSVDELEAAFAAAEVEETDDQPVETAPVAVTEDLSKNKESSIANQSIRVNVDVLENLMTMVSELVLTRNQLLEMVRHLDDSEFEVPLQRLSNVTGELQEGIMKTRVQPIGNAWQKLPRIVRDLSQELDKKMVLDMQGAETELDRQVLELIKDPLTHMVRNSADHGLETPEERLAAGKPETGRIVLKAYHEGGHIIIEVADDGRGLNIAKIKEKILANGLATKSELGGMSETQIQKFVLMQVSQRHKSSPMCLVAVWAWMLCGPISRLLAAPSIFGPKKVKALPSPSRYHSRWRLFPR